MEEAPKARKKEIMRVTLLGSFANFVLLVFKFVAGIWGHSSAMIADAVHSLSDFVTDIVVLLFVNISSKPKDESHDYGHGKYETLATSIVGIVLLCVGFGLFWEGANKIYDFYFKGIPLESPGMIALVAALISIVIKELLYHITVWVGRKQNSQVVIANAWHHRSDAFSSVGALIGIAGARLGFPVMDSIASLVIFIFIAKAAYEIFKDAVDKVVDHSCDSETEKQLYDCVMENENVLGIDLLQTRIFGNKIYVDVEILVDGSKSLREAHTIAEAVHEKIERDFSRVKHIMVHVNPKA